MKKLLLCISMLLINFSTQPMWKFTKIITSTAVVGGSTTAGFINGFIENPQRNFIIRTDDAFDTIKKLPQIHAEITKKLAREYFKNQTLAKVLFDESDSDKKFPGQTGPSESI